MKRYFLAAALAVLAIAQVNADNTGRAAIRNVAAQSAPAPAAAPAAPVPGVVTGSCQACAAEGHGDPRVGLHPIFRRMMFWKKGGCHTCGRAGGGLFGPRCNNRGGAGEFNPYPEGVPGTLVFPQHPFVRSPRDYFMWEAK